MVPISVPPTLAQLITTSAIAPPVISSTAARTARASRASTFRESSAKPSSPTRASAASVASSPRSRPFPRRRAWRASARIKVPLFPPAPITAMVRPARARRRASAGAPATSRAARATPWGMSEGSTAAIPLSKRMASPTTSTHSPLGATRTIFWSERGVRESETRVATRSPTFARKVPFQSFPISATVPRSIPPLPVSGFCCLPRVATIWRILSPTLERSPPASSSIWRKLEESMFSRSTAIRISLLQGGREASITSAAWGSTPLGFSTRWTPKRSPFPLADTGADSRAFRGERPANGGEQEGVPCRSGERSLRRPGGGGSEDPADVPHALRGADQVVGELVHPRLAGQLGKLLHRPGIGGTQPRPAGQRDGGAHHRHLDPALRCAVDGEDELAVPAYLVGAVLELSCRVVTRLGHAVAGEELLEGGQVGVEGVPDGAHALGGEAERLRVRHGSMI